MDADWRIRALGYPYSAPPGDCVWIDGRVEPWAGGDIAALGAMGTVAGAPRTPVLAIGSNRAPDQLARKFADFAAPCAIPLARARLKGFDVVFGAGIAGYGAVGGATLAPSPGTEVQVWVSWLDDAQLARMHATEGLAAGVYGFLELQEIELTFDAGPVWTSALAYVQRRGALNIGGGPIALAEAPATRRRFAALRQRQLQAALRDRFAPGATVDAFVLENLADPALRRRRVAALSADAVAFDWPNVVDRTPSVG